VKASLLSSGPGAGMMWVRRSAIAVLVAGLLLASAMPSSRRVEGHAKKVLNPVAQSARRRALANLAPRPIAVTHFSPWRSRLKTVLHDTHPRVIEEMDLGPVTLPLHFVGFDPTARPLCQLLSSIPLRC
jgi:hypothetical protein